MISDAKSILNKYRSRGIMKAGELLLSPHDALLLAGDLLVAGIPIIGIDIWYNVGEHIAEDPGGCDFSNLLSHIDPAVITNTATKQYILHNLPNHIKWVSFIIDDD